MKANPQFRSQNKAFWACVRSLSQELGYTVKRQNRIKVPTVHDMREGFIKLELNPELIGNKNNEPTMLGKELSEYFSYRAHVLETSVQSQLMNVADAKALFQKLKKQLDPSCPLPLNKQKGEKKAPAYLTGIVNMLVESYSKMAACDYDPRKLTTITQNGVPLRTLARRVDGAFPNTVNPIAIWEVKEYYYTTTFGSRIADGVYESLLDGMELEELRSSHKVDVKHYLFVDAKDCWWDDGKPYLCRIVDMLNMGYVDEVLFGREVATELPRIVSEWISLAEGHIKRGDADPPASL